MTKVCILHTLYYNFSKGKGYTVEPPLTATSLQWPLTSLPKVAVVEGFNCTTVVFYMTGINHFSKIQLVVYYQCCVLIG